MRTTTFLAVPGLEQGGSCLIPFLSCCHLEPNEKESKSVKLQRQRKRIEQTKEQRPYFVGSTYLAKGSGTSSFGPFHRHSDFALDFESYIIGFLLLFLCLLLRLLLKQWSISVTTALIRLDKGESVDRAYGPQDLLLSGRLLLSHTRTDFDFHVWSKKHYTLHWFEYLDYF